MFGQNHKSKMEREREVERIERDKIERYGVELGMHVISFCRDSENELNMTCLLCCCFFFFCLFVMLLIFHRCPNLHTS